MTPRWFFQKLVASGFNPSRLQAHDIDLEKGDTVDETLARFRNATARRNRLTVANAHKSSNLVAGTKRRIAGLSLPATNTGRSTGSGSVVSGPMLALLMAWPVARRLSLALKEKVQRHSGPACDHTEIPWWYRRSWHPIGAFGCVPLTIQATRPVSAALCPGGTYFSQQAGQLRTGS